MRFETLFKKLSKLQARKVKVLAEDGHDHDHDHDRDRDRDRDQKKLAGSTMVADEHPLNPVSNSISLHSDADIETPKQLGGLRRSNPRPHLRHVSFASTPSYIQPPGRIGTADPDHDYVEIHDFSRAVLLNESTTSNTDGDDYDKNNGGFGINDNGGRTSNTGVVTLKIVLRKQHYEELLRDGGEGLLDAFLSNTRAIAEGCRWPKDNSAPQSYSSSNLIPVP